MRNSFRFTIFVLAAVFLAWNGCPVSAQEKPLRKVTFIPQWQPQSQFAGYYVAQKMGIYKKYGLDVDILQGGPDSPSSELVERGYADFGSMFLSYGIKRRAQGVPLVNIGQFIQKSSLMLVARKKSGITSPADLEGRKVGIWGEDFHVQVRAFFKRYRVSVNYVPQTQTINLFLRGGVDAASAMWYNEYHLMLMAGLDPDELTTFFFNELDVNFPEDGIYCLLGTYRRDPETCEKFVRASIEGWIYAFENPEQALDIVMSHVYAANIPTDRCHQRWMLNRMRDIILVDEPGRPGTRIPMGVLRRDDYAGVSSSMLMAGVIDNIPAYAAFYKGAPDHDSE